MKPFVNLSFKLTIFSKDSGMKPWIKYSTTTIAVLAWVIFINQRETPGQAATPDHDISAQQQSSSIVRVGPGFIYLPDGSTVMLDEGAELRYNTITFSKQREVTLTGQAYFDVQHNNNATFRVHSGNVTTTVLGTTFNIQAYAGHAQVKVTVAHGKVGVGDKTTTYDVLTDKEQITVNNVTHKFVKTRVDVDTIIGWRDKYSIIIDNKPLTEAKSLIEETYHVQIVLANDKLATVALSAGFEKGRHLTEVLDIITLLVNASYTIDGNKVVIRSNE